MPWQRRGHNHNAWALEVMLRSVKPSSKSTSLTHTTRGTGEETRMKHSQKLIQKKN